MSEGVTMTKRPRRSFTDEFKAETVRFVRESGKSISAAARDLDLSENAVRDWVRRADDSSAGGPLTKAERDEVQRLRREVRVLRMERDILKKATAFFAKESR
jgi:transposase